MKNVQQLQTAGRAFAAILGHGFVVTWGDAGNGGDSTAVQGQLSNVQQLQATRHASAAVLGDGSVVAWGKAEYGGDKRAVQDELKNVQQIQATRRAFAAILGDGSVVTWGDADHGGDSRPVGAQLKNVQQIQASDTAFAAILEDGSLVSWGDPFYGGDCSAVQDQPDPGLSRRFCCHPRRWIRGDLGGDADYGGDSTAVQGQLENVKQIQASCGPYGAFAAVLGDGSVVTWGAPGYGGDRLLPHRGCRGTVSDEDRRLLVGAAHPAAEAEMEAKQPLRRELGPDLGLRALPVCAAGQGSQKVCLAFRK
eukprot:s2044_g7.t1